MNFKDTGLSAFSWMLKLIAWLKPTYESPRGLSICDLFANFSA